MIEPPERGFVAPGTLVRPGLLGRVFRLGLGVLILLGMLPIVQDFTYFRDVTTVPGNVTLWIFSAIILSATHHVVNLGLGVSWGRWPQIVVVALAVIAIALDLLFYGRLWAPPLGILYFVWIVVIAIPLGVAFVISGLLGTPGCEMRGFADLWARLRRQDASEHYCPGGIDFVDRWEARFRKS